MSKIDKEYSKKVTDRFIELCQQGKILYTDQLRFLDFIKERYKPVTISAYSRKKSRNYKLVQEDYRNDKLAGIDFGVVNFIYENFN